ncbi:cysteine hydrolase family protein [Rouxiella sp. T17]|uniref:cysteine hydrolase family protein n=1 Tax=Rouxiella sp. T17 TaxID=3085684 RepID=UPI002FC8992C
MQNNSSSKQALLVIDMQIGQCSVEPLPLHREELLNNINRLTEHFHSRHLPVIFVRHAGPPGSPFAKGEAIWNIVPELNFDADKDIVVDKSRASCFDNTPLAELLVEQKVSELVIVGLKTQYCVDTACRTASAYGFKPILISDAHSCINTDQLSAEAIIRHHNACLNGPVARVVSTDAFIAQ